MRDEYFLLRKSEFRCIGWSWTELLSIRNSGETLKQSRSMPNCRSFCCCCCCCCCPLLLLLLLLLPLLLMPLLPPVPAAAASALLLLLLLPLLLLPLLPLPLLLPLFLLLPLPLLLLLPSAHAAARAAPGDAAVTDASLSPAVIVEAPAAGDGRNRVYYHLCDPA